MPHRALYTKLCYTAAEMTTGVLSTLCTRHHLYSSHVRVAVAMLVVLSLSCSYLVNWPPYQVRAGASQYLVVLDVGSWMLEWAGCRMDTAETCRMNSVE